MPSTYKINNLHDFLEIPEHRLDACLFEFKNYFRMVRPAESFLSVVAEAVLRKTVEFSVNGFTWIDDSQLNASLDISFASSMNSGQSFDYEISTVFQRLHSNPPKFLDLHPHTFEVTLYLRAIREPGDLYGLDMCHVQNQLQEWCNCIPPAVNDLIPSGTTEDLCLYFTQIPLEKSIQLTAVSVSETPERVTRLNCCERL